MEHTLSQAMWMDNKFQNQWDLELQAQMFFNHSKPIFWWTLTLAVDGKKLIIRWYW